MNYGKRIKYLRKLRGLTLQELGVMMDINENTANSRIAQYEMGLRHPREKYMEKLSICLDVDQSVLFSNHPNPLMNVYIDLYWLLLEGNNILLASSLLERAKEKDSNFKEFETLINFK